MSGSDEIRRLSDELARDPGSLVFLQLGESLRRQGQADLALRVAVRGLERHPHNPEAHDLLARIAVDRGELERAFDEWDMVLRLAPSHVGARKGMGFICFRQGRLEEAERYLAAALGADAGDQSIASALAHVRSQLQSEGGDAAASPGIAPSAGDAAAPAAAAPSPAAPPAERPSAPPESAGRPSPAPAQEPPRPQASGAQGAPPPTGGGAAMPRDSRMLFADVIGEGDQTALLLDSQGLVMAGLYISPDGRDVSQEVGAELSGVSDEAGRAMRHLGLGAWSSIIFETEAATVAMAPAPHDGLLLVASSREAPLGFVRRLLDRVADRARRWMGAA